MSRIYYFGCIDHVGHFLHSASGRHMYDDGRGGLIPWDRIDGNLCPGGALARESDQIEGLALVHHLKGWSALAFWDRSLDVRSGANSAFFVEGPHGFEALVSSAKETFPHVWARFKFEVRDVTRLAAAPAPTRRKPAIEPIYDDVFFAGARQIDELAGLSESKAFEPWSIAAEPGLPDRCQPCDEVAIAILRLLRERGSLPEMSLASLVEEEIESRRFDSATFLSELDSLAGDRKIQQNSSEHWEMVP